MLRNLCFQIVEAEKGDEQWRVVGALMFGSETAKALPGVLSRLGLAGGAVYDALVALAAAEHQADLATRDARARATYEMVGVRVLVAA